MILALPGPWHAGPRPGPPDTAPLDGFIGTLSRDQTKGLERPLEKARAIYNYVLSTMRYDRTGEGWWRGDAILACNAKS